MLYPCTKFLQCSLNFQSLFIQDKYILLFSIWFIPLCWRRSTRTVQSLLNSCFRVLLKYLQLRHNLVNFSFVGMPLCNQKAKSSMYCIVIFYFTSWYSFFFYLSTSSFLCPCPLPDLVIFSTVQDFVFYIFNVSFN